MNTTEWFPAYVRPVHVGYYDVRYLGDRADGSVYVRYFWNGSDWQRDDLDDAKPIWGDPEFGIDGEFWRGLREPA